MAFHEQFMLKAVLPTLATSDGLTAEESELLQSILADCELDDLLLTANDVSVQDDLELPLAKPQHKRTYEQRRHEIDILDSKAQLLIAKLAFLKHRAGIQDGESIAQQELNNSMLRELLRSQQLLVAGFRSLMATNESEYDLCPVSTHIHLESDLAARHRMLKSLQFMKLHDARRFLEKRTQFSPKTARFSESTRRRTDEGDTIAEKLDIVPLANTTSVKQVYDALAFYFAHLEICMTEFLGDVTVRKDSTENETRDKDRSIKQHRFLYNHRELHVETNSVAFSQYNKNHKSAQTGECQEDGIFATDFVDQDDLFPYCPLVRLRKGIVSVLHVQSFNQSPEYRQSTNGPATNHEELSDDDTGKREKAEQVVVLTMWVQSKLRRCELDVSEGRILELIEGTDRVRKAILKSVRATLRCMGQE